MPDSPSSTAEIPKPATAMLPWLAGPAGGRVVKAEGHQPFLIGSPGDAWLVTAGHVDVFAVQLENGEPKGAREHFLSVDEGDLILGIDFNRFGIGYGFLAVGVSGTVLCHFNWDHLPAAPGFDAHHGEWCALVDGWITRVSDASVRAIPHRSKADNRALPGETVEMKAHGILSSRRGVAWVDARSSEFLFLSTEELFFENERSVFPLAPATWLECYEDGPVATLDTGGILLAGNLSEGIWNFHLAVCNNEFINKRLVAVDEYNRLKTKAEYQQIAREEALAEVASVLNPEFAEMVDVRTTGEGDPLLAAATLVGKALGVEIKPHPGTGGSKDPLYRLDGIAKTSRCRVREIALRDIWWTRDSGPFLAFTEEDNEPVALLPASPKSYVMVHGSTGRRVKVDKAVAESLRPMARVIYRPLPDGKLNGWDLVKFASRGLKLEFQTIALMGVGLGMLGLVTPFLTRQIFDDVIPAAARGELLQLTFGMMAAALGILAFEMTRAVAVLRIEGKMDYTVQSALWDRLMSLPLDFFRNYSAGDLANRAYGIDKIRELVSGVGVSAILGSITAMFYLILMFKTNIPMAVVGVLLVVLAMVFTGAMNVWQMKHQKKLYQVIGRITSTVLQFISGVAKIRVAGAEDHAFKVWARQFTQQRRISFIVGRIQNAVQVFTAFFPILANLCLFSMVVYVQTQAMEDGLPSPVSTGDFIAFNTAFGTFLASMLSLSSASLQIFQVKPVYDRFKPILDADPEVDEAKSYPGDLRGEIEVYHVNFRYTPDGPMILKNVSISIKPGEFVAFVGPSGSGKSTMLRLLLGFEKPESGKIYYDGQDLASLDLREVRQQIGVVLQTSRLMPTDLQRNILGNKPLTEKDAWEAAANAGLEADIRALPMGMHTVVSEGGGGFSGGQKQRLMIARAIVHRPRMMFLDEATSALDNRAQAIVTESMDKLQATRVVVAHRLSTIRNANSIYVFVDGRVAEKGSYDELMALDGHFAELARRQIA